MVNFCKSKKTLIGKTAIITGANTGIGYETTLEFAKRGCRVIMACGNQEEGNEARDKITKATSNPNIVVKHLNLESLSSVREFAKDIIDSEDELNLLINNGEAADSLPDKVTEDGHQLTMAVNYYSLFLLTNLLLDLLRDSAPSRIVNVSSFLAKFIIYFNLDELNNYSDWIFGRSKLCLIYFTQELAKRLEGTGVTTYSVHPGYVRDEFAKITNAWEWITTKIYRTPEEGAQCLLHCALEDGIEEHSGEHFDDCESVKPYLTACDKRKRVRLWEITEGMVGLRHYNNYVQE